MTSKADNNGNPTSNNENQQVPPPQHTSQARLVSGGNTTMARNSGRSTVRGRNISSTSGSNRKVREDPLLLWCRSLMKPYFERIYLETRKERSLLWIDNKSYRREVPAGKRHGGKVALLYKAIQGLQIEGLGWGSWRDQIVTATFIEKLSKELSRELDKPEDTEETHHDDYQEESQEENEEDYEEDTTTEEDSDEDTTSPSPSHARTVAGISSMCFAAGLIADGDKGVSGSTFGRGFDSVSRISSTPLSGSKFGSTNYSFKGLPNTSGAFSGDTTFQGPGTRQDRSNGDGIFSRLQFEGEILIKEARGLLYHSQEHQSVRWEEIQQELDVIMVQLLNTRRLEA